MPETHLGYPAVAQSQGDLASNPRLTKLDLCACSLQAVPLPCALPAATAAPCWEHGPRTGPIHLIL